MISSKLLSEVAIAFVEGEDFNAQIGEALKAIGEWQQLSRVSVFLDGADHFIRARAFEWHAQDTPSLLPSLENISFDSFHSFRLMLREERRIMATDFSALPDEMRRWIAPRGAQSLLIYPIMMGERVAGFVMFEDCDKPRQWTEPVRDLLSTASEIISAFCERKINGEQARVSEDNFRRLFSTIDDLIVVADLNGKIIFTNPAVEVKLGFTASELREMEIMNLSAPDNSAEARSALGAMYQQEKVAATLFLCHKAGHRLMVESRVWLGQWNDRDCIFFISKDLSKEQEALQKFTTIFETNPALLAITSYGDGRFTDVNATFLEKLGYTRDEVIGKTSCELELFLDEAHRPDVTPDMRKAGVIRNIEMKVRRKDGSVIDGLLSGATIESLGKKYWLTFMVDISDQIALRDTLQSQRKRLSNIIDGARMGTWEWNISTDEVILNERWADIFGYTLAELTPMKMTSLRKLVHPEDLEKFDRLVEQHFAGVAVRYDYECRMRHRNMQWVWVHIRGKVIEWGLDGKPLMMFGTLTDISERKALEERIIEISIRDSLTGVYNRRYVFERLDEIFAEYTRRGRNFSIAILDIDHFKRVNDSFGHLAGDFILKQFADIVNASIRSYDILGRYGGEEFILVSVNTTARETITLIERIMSIIRERVFVYHDAAISFRFSCGMADTSEFSPGAVSVEKMVELADQRLYRAKETGRDRLIAPASGK